MKVAIVGASGFIGSRVLEKFYLEHRLDVVPIVHSYSSLVRPARFNVPRIACDHTNVNELASAFDGCETVVLAAFGSPLNRINKAIYLAANKAKVKRVVVLSSAAVYNQNPEPGITEESPLPKVPSTPYNVAKIKADDVLRSQRANGDTEIVFLMPMIVFGPRSHWLTRVVKQSLEGTAFLINEGKGICSSVYVDNLVEAIRLCLTAPNVDGESFFISDAETVTWADFYRPIVSALGMPFDSVQFMEPPTFPAPLMREQLQDQLTNLTESPTIQKVKPHVPAGVKGIYKSARSMLQAKVAAPDEFEPPASPVIRPDLDLSLLQQSVYKFPNSKAERRLGYKPVVTFDEAMRRSISWLEFAGYPIATAVKNRSAGSD